MADQVWYPELGLRENPFRYVDAAAIALPKVENGLFKVVEAVIEASEDALIVGEWGLGKTAMAQALAEKYKAVFIQGLSDVDRVEAAILAELDRLGLRKLKDLCRAGLRAFVFKQTQRLEDLFHGRCTYCPQRCDMRQVEPRLMDVKRRFSLELLEEVLNRFATLSLIHI